MQINIALLTILLSIIWINGICCISGSRRRANTSPRPTIPKINTEVPSTAFTFPDGTKLVSYNTLYYFKQLIDHGDPNKGTFYQQYFFSCEYYKKGGPVIFMAGGEENIDAVAHYVTNETVNGLVAKQHNGAIALVKSRYFGESNPYSNLREPSLRVHTVEQSLQDMVYFAQNVDFPMTNGNEVHPDNNPWITIGASFSGALSAWAVRIYPGIFYAGYASSAVVEPIADFSAYYLPIQKHMPQNCSNDVKAVIAYIDDVFNGNDQNKINSTKALFGFENLTHLDDATGALRNNLWVWQDQQPSTGPNGPFYEFCDALEVKDGKTAGSNGWGLKYALGAWVCGNEDVNTCLGTYDPTLPYYIDTSTGNVIRSFEWLECNELGFFEDSPPPLSIGAPKIITSLVPVQYDLRQCGYFFPETFPTPRSPDVQALILKTSGWDIEVERVFFSNAWKGPWRDATVSSDSHFRQSTEAMPIFVSGGGFHGSDLVNENAEADPTVKQAQDLGMQYLAKWLAEWKPPASTK